MASIQYWRRIASALIPGQICPLRAQIDKKDGPRGQNAFHQCESRAGRVRRTAAIVRGAGRRQSNTLGIANPARPARCERDRRRWQNLDAGAIDAHAHITGLSLSPRNISYPASEIAIAAANYLRCSLMDGFTSIREAGGADHGVARLLAEGKIIGPRLFYSGRALTQTGGGADFRSPDETIDPCGDSGPFSVMSVICDGVDQVRKAAREELRRGASQIKVFVSGGVVFPSEAHATIYEYSLEELRAIVEEAKGRGTYAMAHVYTDEGVRRCLEAGVRSIEHANFVGEETVALMAQRGAYLDPTFISLVQRIESAPANRAAAKHRREPEDNRVKGAASVSMGETVPGANRIWYRPLGSRGAEVTGAGIRNENRTRRCRQYRAVGHAYQRRSIDAARESGSHCPGAYADLLVVEGDPLSDVRVMTDPAKNLKLIMKDGVIYK